METSIIVKGTTIIAKTIAIKSVVIIVVMVIIL